MNIDAAFAKLTPARWSEILPLRPMERAKRFVIPLEDNLEKVSFAKTLVAEVVAGRQNNAGVRWRYSGANEEKAKHFDLAATFYHACFCAMRDIIQAQEQVIVDIWPCVEFDYFTNCHDTCRSLRKKRLPRKNVAVRTFYPPWHFGCASYVRDSNQKPSRDFTLSVSPKGMHYFHNPIDVLVSQSLLQDFPGVDFDCHASAVFEMSKIQEK